MTLTTWTVQLLILRLIGFIKVLTKPGKDKILGVTIVSSHAGDLIAEYILSYEIWAWNE